MTEQTLNKPINLANLSLALAKVKSDYMNRLQNAHAIDIISIHRDNGVYYGDYYGDKITDANDILWNAVQNDYCDVCLKYPTDNGYRYYFFDSYNVDNRYLTPQDITFVSYYIDDVDYNANSFTQLCRSEFVYTFSNGVWSLYEYTLDLADAQSQPEVFVGSTTPSGYTIYIDPEDAIPSGEGANF